MERLIALVGERAAALALAQAEPGTEVCREKNVPCSPLLSIRQNAAQLRILLDDGERAWLRELLEASGLKKNGWTKPFRRDQPGQKRLWGILTALLTRPERLLALEPMVGMTAQDREAFARLTALGAERGTEVRFTAARLQDVMRLGIPCRVCFAAGDAWRETDTAALEAEHGADAPETGWDGIQRRWEAKESE